MRSLTLIGEDAKPDGPLKRIEEQAQDRNHDIGTAAYDASTIDEGEVKFAYIGGTLYLYTRRESTIYRVAMTAV